MPRVVPDESLVLLLHEARRTLRLSQEALGRLLGASRRTAGRWESRLSQPGPTTITDLARAVHPHDRDLAARIAAQAGETLVSLQLEGPPVAAPPVRPPVPVAFLVEAVVCAAADALDAKPAAARDSVRAAFQRARAMGLTVQEVDDALRPAPPPDAKDDAKPRSKTRPA